MVHKRGISHVLVARDFRCNSLVLVQKIKPKAWSVYIAKVKYRKGLGKAYRNGHESKYSTR